MAAEWGPCEICGATRQEVPAEERQGCMGCDCDWCAQCEPNVCPWCGDSTAI